MSDLPTVLLCGSNQRVTDYYKHFLSENAYNVLAINPGNWHFVPPDICVVIGKLPSECWNFLIRIAGNGANIKFLFVFEAENICGLPGSNIFLVGSIDKPGEIVKNLPKTIDRILKKN